MVDVMTMGGGAILIAFITAQRLAELWWAKQNEARLMAAGGVEYGHWHLALIMLVHAAWLIGMWFRAYDHSVNPIYLALFIALEIARLSVLITLGRRWTIRIIVVPGEHLVARGPYRFLRHPNYAIVCGEIAVVPLALGMPTYAQVFTLLNAAVFAIRIPEENAALEAASRRESRQITP
jgi:methyltransferase